jgi:hypothetical protein
MRIMSPRIIHIPLSGGDRKAQAKERARRVYSNHLVGIPLRYWQAQGDSR